MGQNESEETQAEIIPLPTMTNLHEIVNELVDANPYTRRRIAQAVLKTASVINQTGEQFRGQVSGSEHAELLPGSGDPDS